MDELQYLMYAENKHSLLIALQGLAAAGKDGVVRHVFTGMNPEGCEDLWIPRNLLLVSLSPSAKT